MNLESIAPVLLGTKTLHHMTARQLGVVALVCSSDAGPWTVRGLALQIGVAKPAITRAIDKLATELALMTRKPDPHDGRSVLVVSTPAGRKFMADLNKALARAR